MVANGTLLFDEKKKKLQVTSMSLSIAVFPRFICAQESELAMHQEEASTEYPHYKNEKMEAERKSMRQTLQSKHSIN